MLEVTSVSTRRKRYLLGLLTVIMVFNYVDRIALGLLLQSIKVDLELSDTQLGFLSGIAFALFYACMGIPIARWADRGDRVTIISWTVALWSIAVALCGSARSFVSLLAIRACVAIGEAGCHPPALSLIADYFSRAERPRAVSRYMLGYPIALLVGYFSAGWLNEIYGWRATFLILGAPGVALAALAWLTLDEPRRDTRSKLSEAIHANQGQADIWVVLRTLWDNSAYRHLLLCFSLSYFFSHGILQWQPAFFIRSHGMTTGELGTWFAAVHGAGGLIGTFIGGELASRYAANNERLQLKMIGCLYAMLAIIKAAVYVSDSHYTALGTLALAAAASAAVNGPLFAATQTIVPPDMRAMSIAVILFCSHLRGMGLGPLAAGGLSDVLSPFFGEESLRYALMVLCPGYIWCTWHLWKASRALEYGATDI